jgi:hypothetical protein
LANDTPPECNSNIMSPSWKPRRAQHVGSGISSFVLDPRQTAATEHRSMNGYRRH